MTDNQHTDAAQLAATLRERQDRADERLRALSPGAEPAYAPANLSGVRIALRLGCGVHLNADQAAALADRLDALEAVERAARGFMANADSKIPYSAINWERVETYKAFVALKAALGGGG